MYIVVNLMNFQQRHPRKASLHRSKKLRQSFLLNHQPQQHKKESSRGSANDSCRNGSWLLQIHILHLLRNWRQFWKCFQISLQSADQFDARSTTRKERGRETAGWFFCATKNSSTSSLRRSRRRRDGRNVGNLGNWCGRDEGRRRVCNYLS